MATVLQSRITERRGRRVNDGNVFVIAAVAALAGLASAAVIGWGTGFWEVAVLFAGAMLASTAIALTVNLFRRGRRITAQAMDRGALTASINTVAEPLMVTDLKGAIICANQAYGSRFGGYPALADLGDDPVQMAGRIGQAGAQAQAQSGAELQVIDPRSGAAVTLAVSMLGGEQTLLLWRVLPDSFAKARQDICAAFDGHIGTALSQARDAALLVSPEGQILSINAHAQLLLGMSERDLTGLAADTVLHSDGSNVYAIAADGGHILLQVREAPLSQDGKLIAYFVQLEERHLVAETDVALPLLPAFLNELPLAVALADRDGRLLYANMRFCEVTQINLQDRIAYPSDIVTDEDRTAVSDLVRRVGARAASSQQSVVRLRANPEQPVKLLVSQAKGSGPETCVLTITDNAEQQRLEQHLAQAQKMQAVGQLAGGIAHDFNNILQAIIGYCDLLLQRHLPGDASFADINQILSNANRAAGLVRQLLAYSRQQSLRPSVERVAELITDQVGTLKQLVREKATLDVHHARDVGYVRVDPNQFYQVLMNLVVNARDAIVHKGSITVNTRMATPADAPERERAIMPQGDYVLISVTDSGSGIAPEHVAKIFDPFFTTKDVGKGTGLGLSTVYGIIKQSSGFIFVESAPGKGTSFNVFLPACEAPLIEDMPRKADVVEDLWGHGTILFVEDEDAVRTFATKALERKGYKVLPAASGEQALELLSEHGASIDLLISDVVMPNMDGPTVVKHARAAYPALKVIMISGYAEESLRKSIETPDIGFLPKPFQLKELATAVKRVLTREPDTNK
jgi:two-component system, cell cycle sensor histidine kinase and response regulator CckA